MGGSKHKVFCKKCKIVFYCTLHCGRYKGLYERKSECLCWSCDLANIEWKNKCGKGKQWKQNIK